MLPYQFSGQARHFLKQADRSLARRLFAAITRLRTDPFPRDTKRVEGYGEKLFRIRVGDYRILYVVRDDPPMLDIAVIDKRSRAYD